MKTQNTERQTFSHTGTWDEQPGSWKATPQWDNVEEGKSYPEWMTPTQCRVVNSILQGRSWMTSHLEKGRRIEVQVSHIHDKLISIVVKHEECTTLDIILDTYSKHYFVGKRGKIEEAGKAIKSNK